jgi:hypothetical protein
MRARRLNARVRFTGWLLFEGEVTGADLEGGERGSQQADEKKRKEIYSRQSFWEAGSETGVSEPERNQKKPA